jgi:hypothetical protein
MLTFITKYNIHATPFAVKEFTGRKRQPRG